MSPEQQKPQHGPSSRKVVSKRINQILSGIRVPDLPYPAGKVAPEAEPEWRSLLLSCWTAQRDERVTEVLGSVDIAWTVRQVNAAYLSDRIMDLFLKTSGLHVTLITRIARLRFWLAWRLDVADSTAFSDLLLDWLDNLQEWRGWSDTGGRSSRALLDQLDALKQVVSTSFEQESPEPVESFCEHWLADARKRIAQVSRLRERLLETEQGASRQRFSDQVSRALIGRALDGRQLPVSISRFILNDWYKVLKQSVWLEGTGGELHRHANKLLEWLVWAGDPELSKHDRSRLYHVGEQIEDRIRNVWSRALSSPPPVDAIAEVQFEIVARVRGDIPELHPALPDPGSFSWDASWLSVSPAPASEAESYHQQWYVEGEGAGEQRRFFFALLEHTNEILWTNGVGAKLGLQSWQSFVSALDNKALKPLPAPTPFGQVLDETVTLLAQVCVKQQKQREKAAEQARARAESLRQEKQAAERKRQQEEVARQAEIERQKAEAEQQRLEDEQAEQQRLRQQMEREAGEQVDSISLGGWIAVVTEAGAEPARLKLAVKIAASSKFVFVDRLGLNRTEFRYDDLVTGIVEGRIRVLGKSAEFDDTLSRVVGRIRVGRS
ncbi:MAG: DUF1631 family protein [Marinobacter sp.]